MKNKQFFSKKPLVYLITDGKTTTENFFDKKSQILKLIKTAVESNVALIQIREKQIPSQLIFEIAAEAAKITQNTATKLLINDRADIAFAANADGVHLTSKSIAADVIKQNFPKNFIAGVSAHTFETAEIARDQGADFVTFSPIFLSPGKGEPQGIEKLRKICEQLNSFPIIALGGVDETNYAEILDAGASGFAAIRFLNDAKKLRKLAVNLI